MAKIFNIVKKTLFLTHFPKFLGKIFFPENPALSRTTSYGFLASCQISEKTNDTVPRKRLDRTEERKDGQTLFYRTLQATTGVPKTPCN